MDNYFINPLAIIFLPQIDRKNNFITVACDWQKEEYIRINPTAYKVLWTIKNNPGKNLSNLALILRMSELKLSKFLEEMEKKNIVSK